MIVLFACRLNRLRDISLVKAGVRAAGHYFCLMPIPWMFPVLVLIGFLRMFGMKVHLVLSDKFPGDTLVARAFGAHCTRMLWNYSDEWPSSGTRIPAHKVCFFQEEGQTVEVFRFAPQPARTATGASLTRPIVFVGDVSLDFELPGGVSWWREQFESLLDRYGYIFYLQPQYEQLLAKGADNSADRRAARLLAKNLLRLRIVEATRRHFGERLILVGSNWRRFGLDAQPSAYSQPVRLSYYRSATVNLDCGSKSGDGSLYPRSSELISLAGGLLQVACADSELAFGRRAREFCFTDEQTLAQCLEVRLSEQPSARELRDDWLLSHLREHNLLMQNSVCSMIAAAHRVRPSA